MKGPAPVHSASAICGSVAAADAAAHSGIAAAFFTPSDVGDFEPLTVKAFVKISPSNEMCALCSLVGLLYAFNCL